MNLNEEIMLTSLVLGELDGEEKRQAEELVANDVRAQTYVDELRALTADLQKEMAAENVPGLGSARRAVLEKATRSHPRTTGFFGDLRPWAVAAGLVLAAAGAISLGWNSPSNQEKPAKEFVSVSVRKVAPEETNIFFEQGGEDQASHANLAQTLSEAERAAGSYPAEVALLNLELKKLNDSSLAPQLGQVNRQHAIPNVGAVVLPQVPGLSGNTPQPGGGGSGRTRDGFAIGGGDYHGPPHSAPIAGGAAPGSKVSTVTPSLNGKPYDARRKNMYSFTKPGRVSGSKSTGLTPKPPKRKYIKSLNVDLVVRDRSGEAYSSFKESGFALVGVSPLSTIGLDVDTASYANVRRFLNNKQMPPRGAVRVDEMINYFHYDDPKPETGEPLRVHAEVAACPWNLDNRLLRIGFRAKTVDRKNRGPSNLVFLVDVSGSMKNANKLPLLIRGLQAMVKQLGEDDRVAIVTYAGSSGLALPATRGSEKGVILAALERLSAAGSTNGASGIEMAYRVASENFELEGVNRVILCTDGDFNVGVSDTNALVKIIKKKAKTGVFLSVLGFGSGNIKDDKMEALANKGDGHYAYIDGDKEAKKVLVEELEGTLITVAKDCKLQVEFNPNEVASYRLLGYTSRVLAAEDFNDDSKDGGEIGAGHTVVALYEIRPAANKDGSPLVDPLKYQKQVVPTDAGAPGEIGTVKVRYKLPDQKQSRVRMLTVVDKGQNYSDASTDFKLSSSVALFGMLLSHSTYAGQTSYDTAFELALGSLGKDNDPRGLRKELCGLIQAAKVLAAPVKGEQ